MKNTLFLRKLSSWDASAALNHACGEKSRYSPHVLRRIALLLALIACYDRVMYIYEQQDWPNFYWNQDAIKNLLIHIRRLQGRLLGGMQALGFPFHEEALLQTFTSDVVKSSEIEGEILDKEAVRSSVARHLGMERAATHPYDRHVEGVVEMVLDATKNFERSLTKERLFAWHASLFPTGWSGLAKIRVGSWRLGPVQVVSGKMGKETVHFEGPKASQMEREMELFFAWSNRKTAHDPLVKAALSHLWFITIHPFEDGNGRIGRAIADMMLARSENSSERFYSLSAQIQAERKSYYDILEKTQKGGLEVTGWIEWFLSCLTRAIENALSTLDTLLHKERYWRSLTKLPLNDRQRKVINLLLGGFEGKLTTSKWAKITSCSQDTAYRDILDLLNKGILVKAAEGGRSTSYFLA